MKIKNQQLFSRLSVESNLIRLFYFLFFFHFALKEHTLPKLTKKTLYSLDIKCSNIDIPIFVFDEHIQRNEEHTH